METIWLRFPQRGYGPMHAMVMSNALDPYAAPRMPALTGQHSKHTSRHYIRDCKIMEGRGILKWSNVGYVWTTVGRAVAICMRKVHQLVEVTETDPIANLRAIRFFDLMEWIDVGTRVELLNMPTRPEIGMPPWTRIMVDLGVVKVRQRTTTLEWALPSEAVLEFFKQYPRYLPHSNDLFTPPNMRAIDRERQIYLHQKLRIMRLEYEASGPTAEDWDII